MTSFQDPDWQQASEDLRDLECLVNQAKLTWPAKSAAGDSPEQAVRRLLLACRKHLEAIGDDGLKPALARRAVLFARVVLKYATVKKRKLCGKDVQYLRDKYCAAAFAWFLALEVVAAESKSLERVDEASFARHYDTVDEFFRAAASHPGVLAKRPASLQARVLASLGRRRLTDEQFLDFARQCMQLDSTDFEQLRAGCRWTRWRTYTETMLKQIAGNYGKWHVLVRSLLSPDPRPAEVQQRLDEVIGKIAAVVKSNLGGDIGDVRARVLNALHQRLARYTYEADLPTFFIKVVFNDMRGYARTEGVRVELPDSTRGPDLSGKLDPPDNEQAERWADVFDEWNSRFLLAVCTFSPQLRAALGVVWAALLDKAACVGDGQRRWNDLISERILKQLGEVRPPTSVAGLRNRLSKRLACLEFVFDRSPQAGEGLPRGAAVEDLPGDESLLAYLRSECGQVEQEEILRRLAALGRAARELKDISHVTHAVLVLESKPALSEVEGSPEPWRQVLVDFRKQQGLAAARRGIGDVSEHHAEKLTRLSRVNPARVRRQLRKAKATFFQDGLLILRVGEQWESSRIVKTLNPRSDEVEVVSQACETCSAPRCGNP